jgi:prefoldin subunit 5
VPVYEGATFYYTTYDLQDSKNTVKKKAIVDLVTSNLTIQETENFSSSTYNAEMVESEEIEEAWDDLENRITEKRADIETVSSQASVYSIQATGYTKMFLMFRII